MGRPETISCERCSAEVAVKAKGPVPSFCAECRRKSRKTTAAVRPASISCQRCGAQVAVKPRGPLPKTCRGGCETSKTEVPVGVTPVEAEAAKPEPEETPPPQVTKNKKEKAPAAPSVEAPPVQRPWDRNKEASKPGTRPVTVTPPGPTRTKSRPVPALTGAAVTRMDQHHPVTIMQPQDLGRRFKAQQLRQAAAIGLWLAVIAIIALVVFIGSQPAAPNF